MPSGRGLAVSYLREGLWVLFFSAVLYPNKALTQSRTQSKCSKILKIMAQL
jgi:hypothetical protein